MTTEKQAPEAEHALVGFLLAHQQQVGLIMRTGLTAEHFGTATARVLFEEVQTTYWADDPIDALVIGQAVAPRLGRLRGTNESDAVQWVGKLKASQQSAQAGRGATLAETTMRYAGYRKLLEVAAEIEGLVEAGDETPEAIAGRSSQLSMQVATQAALTPEVVSYGDLGRNFVKSLREKRRLRDMGIELGVKFGLRHVDDSTRGVQPTELLMLGGEPGVGKSGIVWPWGERFALRQMQRPAGERVGTLILSLEMGEEPSSTRLAQSLTGIDGGSMREGDVTDQQIKRIIHEWSRNADLPLWVNHSSVIKASTLKAIVVEAIRQHNVGLVIVDHFRYFDLDKRLDREVQEDEEKARFLKEDIAKELNVAVICLTHTTKAIDTPDHRPQLRHLRGSGQISAHADFIAFVYRPARYDDNALETDAELIWAKNRHQPEVTTPFYFDPGRMFVRDL